MTYEASESSTWNGQPIELYRFTRGLRVWTYTTGDMSVIYLGEVYAPVTMRRGQLPMNEERENATLDVYCDPTLDVVEEFVSGATPTPTGLTLYRRHRDEASPTEQSVMFIGAVGVVEFSEGETHMVCVPIQKSIQRKIPRWLYQTQCNHMLYDVNCTVSPVGFTVSAHLTALDGIMLTVPEAAAQPDGYYNGGYLKDGDTFAFIQTHVGDQLMILATSPKLVVGDSIFITAGCDRTKGTCATKFANLENFMGFPYIPDKNPFQGLQ